MATVYSHTHTYSTHTRRSVCTVVVLCALKERRGGGGGGERASKLEEDAAERVFSDREEKGGGNALTNLQGMILEYVSRNVLFFHKKAISFFKKKHCKLTEIWSCIKSWLRYRIMHYQFKTLYYIFETLFLLGKKTFFAPLPCASVRILFLHRPPPPLISLGSGSGYGTWYRVGREREGGREAACVEESN